MSLESFRTDKFYSRIVNAVDAELARQNFVTPIGVFVSMGLLERRDLENWRAGRIPYLEQVITCNLAKTSRILRLLRFHAHDLNLKPSHTVYLRRTASGKIPLRFSKSGVRNIEEAYARHFVRQGKITTLDALTEHQSGGAG